MKILDEGVTENTVLKLRMDRVTDLYHAFEGFQDELLTIDSRDEHVVEFEALENRYYILAGIVNNKLNSASVSLPSTSQLSDSVQNESVIAGTKKRRLKLPDAPLPTFDGQFEHWLSFKNAFQNVIDSQADLSDIDKLHYLQSALVGDAANKIKLFTITSVNYARAWEVCGVTK